MATQRNISNVDARREIARLVAAARQDGASDGYGGKRTDVRVVNPLFLEVSTDPQDSLAAWGVTMHDISPGGVSFWSRKQLPINNMIFIRECTEYNSRPWIAAHIRHRTTALQGQLIGAEFDVAVKGDAVPWQETTAGPV